MKLAPADDLQICEVRLPELVPRRGLVGELVARPLSSDQWRTIARPRSRFFMQPVLEGEVRHGRLRCSRLGTEILHLRDRRLTHSVVGQAPPAGFEGLLGSGMAEARGDPLAAAELGDALIATQPFQDDPGSRAHSDLWPSPP